MKIEEAILYCLASQNRGMRTEQIAEERNFSTTPYFCSFFKRNVGTTPTDYRKNY